MSVRDRIPKTHQMYERPGVWPAGGMRGWLFVNEVGAYPVLAEWTLRSEKSWKDRFVKGGWRLISDYGYRWCLAQPKDDPLSSGRQFANEIIQARAEDGPGGEALIGIIGGES